jgi:hypothetical protein
VTEAQAERVIALLTEIRDALVPPPVGEQACLHPEELRVHLGSMGQGDEWICGVRGCRHHHEPTNKERDRCRAIGMTDRTR